MTGQPAWEIFKFKCVEFSLLKGKSIELDWAFMPVLVTSNFDDDAIKNEQLAWRQHFPIINLWEIF